MCEYNHPPILHIYQILGVLIRTGLIIIIDRGKSWNSLSSLKFDICIPNETYSSELHGRIKRDIERRFEL